MTLHGIDIDKEKMAHFCRRHGIRRLSLFGSILRDDLGPDSDIDVLVEFPPDARVSLFELGGMLLELSGILGRQVDLKTPGFIDDRILARVRKEAEVLHAA